MHEYQVANRFDPKTTNFAHSQGYPIFEIMHPQGDRFQEVFSGVFLIFGSFSEFG